MTKNNIVIGFNIGLVILMIMSTGIIANKCTGVKGATVHVLPQIPRDTCTRVNATGVCSTLCKVQKFELGRCDPDDDTKPCECLKCKT